MVFLHAGITKRALEHSRGAHTRRGDASPPVMGPQ